MSVETDVLFESLIERAVYRKDPARMCDLLESALHPVWWQTGTDWAGCLARELESVVTGAGSGELPESLLKRSWELIGAARARRCDHVA